MIEKIKLYKATECMPGKTGPDDDNKCVYLVSIQLHLKKENTCEGNCGMIGIRFYTIRNRLFYGTNDIIFQYKSSIKEIQNHFYAVKFYCGLRVWNTIEDMRKHDFYINAIERVVEIQKNKLCVWRADDIIEWGMLPSLRDYEDEDDRNE